MAFVLFVIYIPNESEHTSDTPEKAGESVGNEKSEEDKQSKVTVSEGEVGVSSTSSPLSETSFETAEDSAKTPDSSELEIDAVPVTSDTSPEAGNAEEPSGERTAVRHEQQDNEPESDVANETAEKTHLVAFFEKGTFIERLKDTLKSLQIHNDVWKVSHDDKTMQVSFVEESGLRCEDIISCLLNIGIGREPNATLSVFPTSIHLQYENDDTETQTKESNDTNGTYISNEEKETEFKKTIKSRLVVAQVEASVEDNAELTFDYVMLIFLASWIAALGLGENSSVVLVASMLISPLMGPILAGIFGTVVKNDKLRNLGIKSELIGLSICIGFGLLAGFIYAGLGVHGKLLGNSDSWPTSEMSSRGVHRSLAVGILIAIPSGAGVALSILGGNAGSLVGVAISASLLPPAVNAGMLWSLSVCAAIYPPEVQMSNMTLDLNTTSAECMPFIDNSYTPTYSCNMAKEAAILGTFSLLLTVLNIVSIFVVGLLVLKLKEVAPHTSASSSAKHFFNDDIKIARESYQTTKGEQSRTLAKKFLEEYKTKMEAPIEEEDDEPVLKQNKRTLYFKTVLQEVENSPDVRSVLNCLPASKSPTSFIFKLQEDFNNAERNIVQKDQEKFNDLMKHPLDSTPNARVYRTIHACDLPTTGHIHSPTIASPRISFRKHGKHPLKKRSTDLYLVSARPKSLHEISLPVIIEDESDPKTKKKPNLKLKIDKPAVEFSKDKKDKDTKFMKVTIEKGHVPGEDIPLLLSEKPRFAVEAVDEKEIQAPKS